MGGDRRIEYHVPSLECIANAKAFATIKYDCPVGKGRT